MTQLQTDAVVHRWDDLPTDHPMPMLRRERIIGEKVMLSRVFLEAGCEVATHTHENEQMAHVLSGRLRFGLGEEGTAQRREVIVEGGEVLHLPANVPHSVVAEADSVVIDVFSPPSEKTGIDRD